MTLCSDWLDRIRHIGNRLVVADEKARSAFVQSLFDSMVPRTASEIRRKFGLHGADMQANIDKIRSEPALALVMGWAHEWQFAEEWAMCGYPQIVVDGKLFSALAETRIPADIIPDLSMPWDTFVVRLPEELRPAPIKWGNIPTPMPISYITCERWPDNATTHVNSGLPIHERGAAKGSRWTLAFRPAGVPACAVRFGFSQLSDLMSGGGTESWWDGMSHPEGVGSKMPYQLDLSDVPQLAKQQCGLLRRAFCGVILEIMNRIDGASPRSVKRGSAPGRTCARPQSTTVVLTRPVLVDLRQRVHQQMNGVRVRGPANTQWYRRGSYVWQTHGPRNTQRRFQWRRPAWCGPSDAPIAVRPHILTGTS